MRIKENDKNAEETPEPPSEHIHHMEASGTSSTQKSSIKARYPLPDNWPTTPKQGFWHQGPHLFFTGSNLSNDTGDASSLPNSQLDTVQEHVFDELKAYLRSTLIFSHRDFSGDAGARFIKAYSSTRRPDPP
jgi:hypothetical protein